MSAVFRAQLKKNPCYCHYNNNNYYSSPLFFFISSVLCWCSQQSFLLCFPTVSMRLRPKRTCSGVECFGGYHINRLFHLFLFFRGPCLSP